MSRRTNGLAGTRGLIRLILRRDRVLLPLWVVVFSLLPVLYASATEEFFPTPEALQQYAASIRTNPSLLASIGPVYGESLGALAAWRSGILILFIGLVSLLTVIRHTRTEEESGRRELLGATVVGRQAPLAAALTVTFCADLVMGALVAVLLMGYGLPAAGSVAFGASLAAVGWVFATVGGVTAQLTEGAGAARGIALSALGTAFLLRAAGDSGGESGSLGWLSWLSPYGWTQRARPYADERWWVLGLLAALTLILTVAAAALLARRDVAAGVVPTGLGPAAASPALRGPLALAWRLHRAPMLGWTTGVAVIGLVIGSASESIDSMVTGGGQLADILERLGGVSALRDAYIAAVLSLLALYTGAYGIQATLRLRAEEAGLRAEPVLATSVSRARWVASHLAFAFGGPVVVLVVLGLAAGLGSGLTMGDVGGQLPRVLAGAVAQLPAVWVLTGLVTALFGLLPRLATGIAWTALAVCVFFSFLGALLQLDQRLLDISPFTHIPKLPGGDLTATPLVWLLAVTVVLTVAGIAGFRRRDLVSSA